eukprot:g46330.t1
MKGIDRAAQSRDGSQLEQTEAGVASGQEQPGAAQSGAEKGRPGTWNGEGTASDLERRMDGQQPGAEQPQPVTWSGEGTASDLERRRDS